MDRQPAAVQIVVDRWQAVRAPVRHFRVQQVKEQFRREFRVDVIALRKPWIDVDVLNDRVRHPRDVDLERKEIRAAGTETHCRDRVVRIAERAWPSIAARVAELESNAPLFPNTDRWRAASAHMARASNSASRTIGSRTGATAMPCAPYERDRRRK